jgi:hypothetical protein
VIGPTSTLIDVAFAVCTALNAAGTTVVLSGGGAATVYAPESVRSHDVDFVLEFVADGSSEALAEIGFTRHGLHYRHPKNSTAVEFLNPPIAILDEEVRAWATLRRDGEILHILAPDDCVRDRLGWFVVGSRIDFSGLDQACAVASAQAVDWEPIDSWVEKNGGAEKLRMLQEYRASRG